MTIRTLRAYLPQPFRLFEKIAAINIRLPRTTFRRSDLVLPRLTILFFGAYALGSLRPSLILDDFTLGKGDFFFGVVAILVLQYEIIRELRSSHDKKAGPR